MGRFVEADHDAWADEVLVAVQAAVAAARGRLPVDGLPRPTLRPCRLLPQVDTATSAVREPPTPAPRRPASDTFPRAVEQVNRGGPGMVDDDDDRSRRPTSPGTGVADAPADEALADGLRLHGQHLLHEAFPDAVQVHRDVADEPRAATHQRQPARPRGAGGRRERARSGAAGPGRIDATV
jgi:hypothetical protein